MNAKAWNFSRLFCSISLVTYHKTYIAHVIGVVTRCISGSITISRSLLNQAREIIATSLQSHTDHVYPYSLSIHIGYYSNQSADLSIGEGNHESMRRNRICSSKKVQKVAKLWKPHDGNTKHARLSNEDMVITSILEVLKDMDWKLHERWFPLPAETGSVLCISMARMANKPRSSYIKTEYEL